MYPRLFEIPLPVFGTVTIYSFGFMVVVAVMAAAWLAGRELDRMYRKGRIGSVRVPVEDDKGRTRTQEVSPSVLIGTVATIAMIAGILGAKLFHILENLDLFFQDPLGMIFSTGGLTFYGGLIVAGFSIAYYLRRHNQSWRDFADALAPGLMLAYGIGRIGCHLAGDGDWGIPADLSLKPDWLPTWLWAETYPNNILGVDIAPPGVYPTSIYEFVMAALLFAALWAVRKHPYKAGWLFALYLVFNGIERFLIEQIRVNNVLDFVFFRATQAEVIAVCTVLLGFAGLVLTWKRRDRAAEQPRVVEKKASATA